MCVCMCVLYWVLCYTSLAVGLVCVHIRHGQSVTMLQGFGCEHLTANAHRGLSFYLMPPTYRFPHHLHVSVHGFGRKGVPSEDQVLILCMMERGRWRWGSGEVGGEEGVG